jgi:hypothetical protein
MTLKRKDMKVKHFNFTHLYIRHIFSHIFILDTFFYNFFLASTLLTKVSWLQYYIWCMMSQVSTFFLFKLSKRLCVYTITYDDRSTCDIRSAYNITYDAGSTCDAKSALFWQAVQKNPKSAVQKNPKKWGQ